MGKGSSYNGAGGLVTSGLKIIPKLRVLSWLASTFAWIAGIELLTNIAVALLQSPGSS
jgi:hypothetical protein